MEVQTTPTPTAPHAEYFPPPPAPAGPSRWLAFSLLFQSDPVGGTTGSAVLGVPEQGEAEEDGGDGAESKAALRQKA